MKTNALPTLTFQHTFANGLTVELQVKRETGKIPRLTSSQQAFQTPELEAEYTAWAHQIGQSLVTDNLLTAPEILAIVMEQLKP